MKISFPTRLILTFATAVLPIHAACADAKLSVQQRGQIWMMTQDIVSVGLEKDFQNGNISNGERIQFGIYQVALRQPKLFQTNNTKGTTRISAKIVAAAATRYFGKTIAPQSVGDWKYRDGFYQGYAESFEQLDDEKITGFRIESAHSNRLTAYINYENSMASADANRDIIERAKLTFKSEIVNGKRRYILNSFAHLTPRL